MRPSASGEITGHGVIPAPSGAGALLLHAEEGPGCLVVLGVLRPVDKARLTAIVNFEWCMQSLFGYPNGEAYGHDPRGAQATGPATASSRSSPRPGPDG